MFTGIIEATGAVSSYVLGGESARLIISSQNFETSTISEGDSIAVNGVCLTAATIREREIEFDVSPETSSVTTGFKIDQIVNLERALTLQTLIGGHLVSGHVDGVAIVKEIEIVDNNWQVVIECPDRLAKYCVNKGSVTLNGVSLTINHASSNQININLVPHTLSVTNLKSLSVGDFVNIEIDMIARYVEKIIGERRTQ
ncbi:MAG: riboflavin synthase [Betaproteobacteria bacterium]